MLVLHLSSKRKTATKFIVNNGKRQSSKNIFFQQPNGAKAETLNASVVQDKARISSARTGTRQPARFRNCSARSN
jgi:hypothetical protein